jgi:hypothetical protein
MAKIPVSTSIDRRVPEPQDQRSATFDFEIGTFSPAADRFCGALERLNALKIPWSSEKKIEGPTISSGSIVVKGTPEQVRMGVEVLNGAFEH